jgi:curved DNA-binding protein
MNHYEVLGVGPDATEQQIKAAYRTQAMKWHPDRHEGAAAKGEADRRFKDLAVAYRTLRNAADRANYDRQLEQQLHREYNERQKEQARQQRAQEEQARQKQARQDPPQARLCRYRPAV